jgi:hypothetical protein
MIYLKLYPNCISRSIDSSPSLRYRGIM